MPDNAGAGGPERLVDGLNEGAQHYDAQIVEAARRFIGHPTRMTINRDVIFIKALASLLMDEGNWLPFESAARRVQDNIDATPAARKALTSDLKTLKQALKDEWYRRAQQRQQDHIAAANSGAPQRTLPKNMVPLEPPQRLEILIPPSVNELNAILFRILKASHVAGTQIMSSRADVQANLLSSEKVGHAPDYRLQTMSREQVLALMVNECLFSRELGENVNAIMPPQEITTLIHKMLVQQAPPLVTRTSTPWLNGDRIVMTPGYERSHGIWYQAIHDAPYDFPEHPTAAQVRGALRVVSNIYLGGFKFTSHADKANVIGSALMTLVQPGCNSRSPVVVVKKPQINSGGSWLCRILTMTGTGALPSPYDWPGDNADEQRKLLFSAVRGLPAAIFLDNVIGTLRGSKLSLITESDMVTDRVLGLSETASVLIRCCVYISGNNVTLDRDMIRRSNLVSLEAFMDDDERAKARKGRPSNPPDWLRLNHRRAIEALLTMVAWWIDKGMPRGKTLDSYDETTGIVGGILKACGIKGWLENRSDEELEDVLEDDEVVTADYLSALWGMVGTDVFHTIEIVEGSPTTENRPWVEHTNLPMPVRTNDAPSNAMLASRLGIWLRKKRRGWHKVPTGEGDNVTIKIVQTARTRSGRGWQFVRAAEQELPL